MMKKHEGQKKQEMKEMNERTKEESQYLMCAIRDHDIEYIWEGVTTSNTFGSFESVFEKEKKIGF